MYHVVIHGGRVMDPLTRTDVVANVGIKNGRIAAILPQEQRLEGKVSIDATGLVVAPGFINIHGHGTGDGVGAKFHVLDGITTEISGNCGFSGLYDEEKGPSDQPARLLFEFFGDLEEKGLVTNLASFAGHITLRNLAGVPDVFTPSTEDQIKEMVQLLAQEMEAGALGISFGPFYGPGTTYEEMVILATEASKLGGGASSHVRHSIAPLDVEAIVEAINTAREAGIPFIISHLGGPTYGPNSSGAALELIVEALEEGLKIITDCHPYDAFCTGLGAAVFDQIPLEQLLEAVSAKMSDLRVASTVVIDGEIVLEAGERFSSTEQWELVRGRLKAGEIADPGVIGHFYKSHKTRLWYSFPYTMVENDGLITIDSVTGKLVGHPRGAGSFARFLGYWVRERGVCDLMTALAKTSTLAAVWLGLDGKGRVQVGSDADITLFDPQRVIDRATYLEPGIPSSGIPYVIVNGVVAVSEGKLTGELAGQVIRRTWKVPGDLPSFNLLPGAGVEALGG